MRMRDVNRQASRRAAGLVAVAGLAIASAAHGQVRNWNNALGGNWSLAANWNPTDVPNSTAETASISLAGSYTVTLDASMTIGSYANTNATATLNIPTGVALATTGGLTNNGVITLNTTAGASGTSLAVLSSQTLTGTGQLVLNANPANLDTALVIWNGGGEMLTQTAGHTIRGTGRIWTRLTNAGLVDADVNGRTLQLGGSFKVNSALMRARNGGTLQVSTDITNTGGTIRADGGSVTFDTVTVADGVVEAINGGSLSVNGSPIFNTVTMSGPASVQSGAVMRINGPLTNNGVITVNPGATGSGTQFQFLNSTSVIGTGQIVLNANPANLDTALVQWNGGGEVFTHGASHTVRGTGRIATAMVNNGTVNADQAGKVLQIASNTKTNNGLMQATGGGIFEASATTVNNGASGQITTTGASTISLVNSVVNNGAIAAPTPGLMVISGTTTMNGVVFSGVGQLLNGNILRTNSGFTNNGELTVNPSGGGSGTQFLVVSSCTVDGTGIITLNANPANLDTAYIIWNGGGEVLTNTATHTIRGTGRVYSIVANNGTIRADVSGRTLELLGGNKTNNATMTATNGANLSVSGIAVTQGAFGSLSTSGGATITLNNATITGGTLNTSAGGPASISNSVINNVTVSGTSFVPNATTIRTNSGFTNNGTLTINPTGGGSGTLLLFGNSSSIGGSGSIVLNANPANLDTAYITWNGGAEVFTNTAAHSVRGTGRIYVIMVNNGTVSADVSGRRLELVSGSKTNNALVRAISGGQLALSSVALNQSAAGRTVAEAGSSWTLSNATISGGRLEVSPGGTGTITGTVLFTSLTTSGIMSSVGGSNLQFNSGGNTNNGEITINGIVQVVSSTTVNGTGRLILNAPTNNLDGSYITWNGGAEVFTNGVDHTLAGRGRVYTRMTNNGTISPGATAGQSAVIDFRNPLTFSATGLLDVEIGGDTEFDTITSVSSVNLGNGRLRVRTYNAYTPNYNQTFDIITCNSRTGVFADIDAPGFQVEYLADRVRLRVICDGDFNQDGNVDQGDVDFLINVIAGGGTSPFLSPDFNRDGNVDQGDIDALINVIAGGACQQ